MQPRRAQAHNLTFRKMLENEAVEASRCNSGVRRAGKDYFNLSKLSTDISSSTASQ